MLDGNVQTKSNIRRRCYQLKYDMIVSPLRNPLTCTVVGFLFNVPIMSAIIIVYEKYTEGGLTYAASMLPIIAQLSLVIFIIFTTMITLGYDLMDKGCLAWHRESLG